MGHGQNFFWNLINSKAAHYLSQVLSLGTDLLVLYEAHKSSHTSHTVGILMSLLVQKHW